MVNCPRCGNRVERLYDLPVESLRGDLRERRTTTVGDGSGIACQACRNEVIEG